MKRKLILILIALVLLAGTSGAYSTNASTLWSNTSLDNASQDLSGNIFISTFDYNEGFEQGLIFNNLTNLTTPTYDGSGQTVHPDVYYNASGWNGFKYWMVITPYPSSDSMYENPSIYVSNDSYNWSVPVGVTNPVSPYPGVNKWNNDPDMVYNASNGSLELYWVESTTAGNFSKLMRNVSSNGTFWKGTVEVLNVSNYDIVSPSIVFNNTEKKYYMWNVNSSSAGSAATSTYIVLRNSTTGTSWNMPQNVTLSIPNRVIWHINVEYVLEKNEYWMIISAGTTTATTANEMWFAYSTDKINWTVSSGAMILPHDGYDSSWDRELIYRGDIKFINNLVEIWYSSKGGTSWATGRLTTTYEDIKRKYFWNRWTTSIYGDFNFSKIQVKNGTYSAKITQTSATGQLILERNVTSSTNVSVETDLYDDGVAGAGNMKLFGTRNPAGSWIRIGVWGGQSTTNYVYHNSAMAYTTTSVARTVGWHRFKLFFWNNNTIDYYIDDVIIASVVGQYNNPTLAILSTNTNGDSFFVDNLRVYTYVTGNVTAWYDSGSNNAISNFTINIINPVNTNYSVYYRQNGSVGFSLLQSNLTGNNTINVTGTKFQNTEVLVQMNSNGTQTTPKLLSITFASETVNSIPPAPVWVSNITGASWVNHTWQAGALGNVTDSYNISLNGVWTNGTTNTSVNTSIVAGGWSNITIWAFNNSGILSATSISNNSQVPASIPTPAPATNASSYKTSICASILNWGVVGSSLLVVLILVIGGGLTFGFMSGTLKTDTFPIHYFVLGVTLVVVIGSMGIAIINPIIIASGC